MGLQISMAAARVNAKMTQEEIAEKMDMARTTIISWETGKTIPKPSQFEMYCNLCNIPKDCVFLPSNPTKS
jgi:transcriptional regulator with XRE-family HTH domain